jgi:hypothetical protein
MMTVEPGPHSGLESSPAGGSPIARTKLDFEAA